MTAFAKVFRIELTGGGDVKKEILAIKSSMDDTRKVIKSLKTELASLLAAKGDAGAVADLNNKIKQLEGSLKSLSSQRKTADDDAKRAAQTEKLLADAKLKEAQASKAQEQANRERIKSQIDQEKELDRQIAAEAREAAALQKKKAVIDAMPGSYRETQKAAKELYQLLANTKQGSNVNFRGQDLSFDQATASLKKLSFQEQAFRRQFQADGTLVGEYAQGIVNAFGRLGIDDIIKNQVTGAKQQLGQLEAKTQELVTAYRKAQAEGSQDLNKLEKEIHDNVTETEKLKQAVAGAEAQLKGIAGVGNQVTTSIQNGFKSLKNNLGQLVLGYVGFQAAFNGIQSNVETAKELSDQTTNLEIELGKAKGGASGLVSELAKLDTRTKLSGLEDIANIAAKAGVSENQLVGVTQAIDKIKIAFGKDFGDVESGTESLVKLVNIFLGTDQVTGDNLLKTGNAIRTLANESVASVPFLNDFSQRMAGLKGISDISLPAVLGLASGFEQFGQSAEVSSTSLVRIIPKLAADTAKYGEIAGITQQAFADLLNSNPAEALIAVSEGLVKGKKNIEEISAAFDDSELGKGRIASVLGVVGKNADSFRKSISSATEAFTDTSNIETAFTAKNENLAASLDKLSKRFSDSANSKVFQIALKTIIGLITILLNNIPLLIGIGSLLALNWGIQAVRLNTLTASTIRNSAAIAFNKTIQTLLLPVEAAMNVALLVLNGTYNILTKAARAFGLVLKGTPLGLFITLVGLLGVAIGGLAAAFASSNREMARQNEIRRQLIETENEAREKISDTLAKEREYLAVINDASISLKERQKALQSLIDINPAYLKGLTLENIATDEGKRLIDAYNQSLLRKAQLEATSARHAAAFQDLVKLEGLKQSLLEQTAAGTKEVKSGDLDKDLEKFIDDEASNFQQRAGISLRKLTGATIPKAFTDEVLKTLDKQIKKQTDKLDVIEQTGKEVIKRVAAAEKEQSEAVIDFRANELGKAKGVEESIQRQLNAAKKGSAEYVELSNKLIEAQNDVLAKRKALFEVLPKDETAAATQKTENVFARFDRLFKNEGTEDDFKTLLKDVQDEKGKTSVFSKKYTELKALEKKIEALIQEKANGRGSKLTGGQKDLFKDIDANRDRLLAVEGQKRLNNEIDEKTYLQHILKINTDALNQKINLIKGKNAEERKLLAQFALEKITLQKETNQKLFDIDNKNNENELANITSGAQRNLEAVQNNPESTNLQTVQAKEEFLKTQLQATIVFNQKQIDLEKKYGIQSIDQAQKRKDAIEKINADLRKTTLEELEATLKDANLAASKQQDELRRNLATQVGTIINDDKLSDKEKAAKLATLTTGGVVDSLSLDVARLGILLKVYKKFLGDKADTDESYIKLQADQADRQNDLDKAKQTQEEDRITNFGTLGEKFKLAIKRMGGLGDILKDAFGIKTFANDIEKIQSAISETIKSIQQTVSQAYQNIFDKQRQEIDIRKQDSLDFEERQKERLLAIAQSDEERATIEHRSEIKRQKIEKQAAEARKKVALKQAAIDYAVALVKTFATYGWPIGLLVGAGLTVAYFAQRATIQSQQFAEGGQVQPKQVGNGKINGGANIARQKNGDNVLATVKTGEVILNERQQQAIGGARVFRRIGVPGFATGGVAGILGSNVQAPVFSAASFVNGTGTRFINDNSDRMAKLEDMHMQVLEAVYASDSKEVQLVSHKVTEAQKRRKKDISVGTI